MSSRASRGKKNRKSDKLVGGASRKGKEFSKEEWLESYETMAIEAIHYREYEEALGWALKRLTAGPPDLEIRELAIRCAEKVRDYSVIYPLLGQTWSEGHSLTADDCFLLGKLALDRKDLLTARSTLSVLLDEPQRLGEECGPERVKEVETCLRYLEAMEMKRASYKKPKFTIPFRPVPPVEESTWAQVRKSMGILPRTPSVRTTQKAAKKTEAPRKPKTAPAEPIPEQAAHAETIEASEALPDLRITVETGADSVQEAISRRRACTPGEFELAMQAYRHSFRVSFDQLICLPTLKNVRSLWYQEETAAKVMKTFRGRAILADEVGLGKTVEAGIILKEYLVRGLIKSALVLVPASLVNQWHEELTEKFALSFATSNDPLFREDPAQFWQEPFIVASLHAARNKRHFNFVTSRTFDLVIVDEAHHLKNQRTLSWKLVNAVQKSFLLLLTATPVQNKLEELYNLVTILKPGHLKTLSAFKEEFVARGNPTDPQNRERLRQLLKKVMVRNTRSVTRLHLPPRYATTTRVSPSDAEEHFYTAISDFISDSVGSEAPGLNSVMLRRLLEAAGSSHYAALSTLEKLVHRSTDGTRDRLETIIAAGRRIDRGTKPCRLLDLVKSLKTQVIVFVNYIATVDFIEQMFQENRVRYVVFSGSMSSQQKQHAMDEFRGGCTVLLSTGTGGEGHNLQFCNTMVNYDLPWNPMQIEQRIGRVHRIGQEKEVQVYNFCAAGSIEDHILEVLDRKINMFELVVGEMEMILGRLQDDRDFSDMVFEIWSGFSEAAKRHSAFEALGSRLTRARTAYEKTRELDEKLFQEDFGV